MKNSKITMADNIENLGAVTDMQKRTPTLEDAYKTYTELVKAAHEALIANSKNLEVVTDTLKTASEDIGEFETGHILAINEVIYEDDCPFGSVIETKEHKIIGDERLHRLRMLLNWQDMITMFKNLSNSK